MAKRHVYSKDAHGFGDFVYVDLLPDVKRSRQFNMNVIIALLYAVVLGFFLIYRPYSADVFKLENLNSIKSDREHELALTQEEFNGYEIDLEAIQFQTDIDTANTLKIDFNNLLDDITLKVSENQGEIKSVSYDVGTGELILIVEFNDSYRYNQLNTEILGVPWVESSTYVIPTDGTFEYEYAIGVDYNVE